MNRETSRMLLVALVCWWALFLNDSRHPQAHAEWSGNFKTKDECERALSREQDHWYDANQGKAQPAWVRGQSGSCEMECDKNSN